MTHRCFLLLLIALPAGVASADVYTIKVIDAATGRGVPLVELTPQSGTTVVTDSNGIAAFNHSGLMNQDVLFGFRSYGYSDLGQILHPTNGGSVQVAIGRTNRA